MIKTFLSQFKSPLLHYKDLKLILANNLALGVSKSIGQFLYWSDTSLRDI